MDRSVAISALFLITGSPGTPFFIQIKACQAARRRLVFQLF
jgi:hypothetical protein